MGIRVRAGLALSRVSAHHQHVHDVRHRCAALRSARAVDHDSSIMRSALHGYDATRSTLRELPDKIMAMRRAGHLAVAAGTSVRFVQLLEIVADAVGDGRKVIVLSQFIEVLNSVCGAPTSRRTLEDPRPPNTHAIRPRYSRSTAGGSFLSSVAASNFDLLAMIFRDFLGSPALRRRDRQIGRAHV